MNHIYVKYVHVRIVGFFLILLSVKIITTSYYFFYIQSSLSLLKDLRPTYKRTKDKESTNTIVEFRLVEKEYNLNRQC